MPKEISMAWKCDWCNKVSISHGAIVNHEKSCKKNPKRRHCGTCVHACLSIDYMHGDPTIEICAPWCAKHDKPMSEKPWFIDCEWETIYELMGDVEEVCMPYTCKGYKYKGSYGFEKKDERDG